MTSSEKAILQSTTEYAYIQTALWEMEAEAQEAAWVEDTSDDEITVIVSQQWDGVIYILIDQYGTLETWDFDQAVYELTAAFVQ